MRLSTAIALLIVISGVIVTEAKNNCVPIYVRWPRVKLTFRPRVEGPYSSKACQLACSSEEHPARSGYPLTCAGFNHKQGANTFGHDCQIYQADQLQNVDGYAEADDRYSFYWKYCIKTDKVCNTDYQFTIFTDRYMDKSEVARILYTTSLEDCLGHCLDEPMFTCRSVSFNRTDGGCHMSAQNQLSKPRYIRLNNNPNFRIDYYESNCYNNSFTFDHQCRDDGILVSVDSQFPYTGVLYGLYDYFTCRLEPKEQKQFSYFFPAPSIARNCSDSIRYRDGDMILEVVLSTDGVEPLYFITPEDLTYQARCTNVNGNEVGASIDFAPAFSDKSKNTFKDTSEEGSGEFSSSSEELEALTLSTAAPKKSTHTLESIDSHLVAKSRRPGTKIQVLVGLPDDLKPSTRRGRLTSTRTRTRTKSTSTATRRTSTFRYTQPPKLPSTTTTRRSSSSSTTTPPTLPPRTTGTSTTRQYTTPPRLPPTTTSTTTRLPTTWTTKKTTTKPTTTTTKPTTTTSTTTTSTSTTTSTTTTTPKPTTTTPAGPTTTTAPQRPILFDIFNQGQPVQAVVVGSRVTLSFTPFYAIPPSYMTVAGCQVEPVGSLYDWEREPLPIVKDGCQADHVGLVCPPERTDFGIRVVAEAFRYQTTAQVQYTCLIRVCPFAPCPQPFCPPVEGCSGNTVVTRESVPLTRSKRQLTLPELRQAFVNNPLIKSQQLQLPQGPAINPAPSALQQHLLALAGDHVVKERLIVVNSENELQYYLRTGTVPNNSFPGFFGGR